MYHKWGDVVETVNFQMNLYYLETNKDIKKKVESDMLKMVKDDTECRRFNLCKAYLFQKTNLLPMHNCCDVYEKKCKCGDELCPSTHKNRQQKTFQSKN